MPGFENLDSTSNHFTANTLDGLSNSPAVRFEADWLCTEVRALLDDNVEKLYDGGRQLVVQSPDIAPLTPNGLLLIRAEEELQENGGSRCTMGTDVFGLQQLLHNVEKVGHVEFIALTRRTGILSSEGSATQPTVAGQYTYDRWEINHFYGPMHIQHGMLTVGRYGDVWAKPTDSQPINDNKCLETDDLMTMGIVPEGGYQYMEGMQLVNLLRKILEGIDPNTCKNVPPHLADFLLGLYEQMD